MKRPWTVRRLIAAGAVALYALAVLLLLPMHLLEEAPEVGVPGGPSVVADCHDRGCEQPAHHHGGHGHAHDPATCVKCSQAVEAGSGVVSAAYAVPAPVFARPSAPPAPPAASSLLRAVPPARGPPALS